MPAALILFPHQLFESNADLARGKRTFLIEDALYFTQFKFHKQKLVLHRATMRMHHDYLRKKGRDVHYLELASVPTMTAAVDAVAKHNVDTLHYINPVDDWLERRLLAAAKACGVKVFRHATPMFLSSDELLERHFSGSGKRVLMANFYVAQRKELGVLVEDGKPIGGRWSFDADNRKPWPKKLQPPTIKRPNINGYVTEARNYVDAQFAGNYGATGDFAYPVTYRDARAWLDQFLQQRLPTFGDYEDAIVADESMLYHSVLTPMLNTGLLTPHQVLEATLQHADRNEISLNSLEGFVRQLIGWREYMRGSYVYRGRAQRTRNFWKHQRRLPETFWTGETGILPLDTVIRRINKGAYAHHIERLMVLANFMQLCEFDPDDIYRWFMELFIDAYDWVMVPNVYAMALYADGGTITTKPYVSSSNYVLKMSDFKRGEWCDVWDGLFWRFVDLHKDFFTRNPRMKMMVNQADRMGPGKLAQHKARADQFLAQLG